MGNNESVPNNYGFKVLEVTSKGPGEKAGLIAQEDFVLTVHGRKLRNMSSEQLKELVQANEDRELILKVMNGRTQKIRDCVIIPTKKWHGQNLLGIKLRLVPFSDMKPEVELTSVEDGDFSWDDIYTSEKGDTVRSTSSTRSTRETTSEPPRLSTMNSFMNSIGDPLSVFRNGN